MIRFVNRTPHYRYLPGDPRVYFTEGANGALYQPHKLSSLWADTAGTVAASVGGTVARIDDRSGNGFHLIQSDAGKRPTLMKEGGYYFLRFAADDFMHIAAATFALALPAYLIAGVRRQNDVAGHLFGAYKDTSNHAYIGGFSTGRINLKAKIGTPSGDATTAQNTANVETGHVYDALLTAGNSSVRVNNSDEAAAANTFAAETLSAAWLGLNLNTSAGTPIAAGSAFDFYGGFIIEEAVDREEATRFMGRRNGAFVPVLGVWHGDARSDGARISVRLTDHGHFRIVASASADLSSPVYSPVLETDDYGVVDIDLPTADANYWYTVEVDGSQAPFVGRLRTLPSGASYDFAMITTYCAVNGSNAVAWDNVRARHLANTDCVGMLFNGDHHYGNPDVEDESVHEGHLDAIYAENRQLTARRDLPWYPMYDDHDGAGGNDNDRLSPGWNAAWAVWRRYAPLPDMELDEGPIYWAKSFGRVRVITPDMRSLRDPKTSTDSPSKTMLGAEQKAWLKAQCILAAQAGQMIWLNLSVPWNCDPASADNYQHYTYERTELADFLIENGIEGRVLIFFGDRHFTAIDSGANNDFSTGAVGNGIPVVGTGPIDQDNTTLAAVTTPFDLGTYSSTGGDLMQSQYGLHEFTMTDTDEMTVRVRAWRIDRTTGGETELFDESFVFAIPALSIDAVAFELDPVSPPLRADTSEGAIAGTLQEILGLAEFPDFDLVNPQTVYASDSVGTVAGDLEEV